MVGNILSSSLVVSSLAMALCTGVISRTLANDALPGVADSPSQAAIFRSSALAEPVVATGTTSAEEDAELSALLANYASGYDLAGLRAIEAWVGKHPTSAWRASLLYNLGNRNFEDGYFSRAIAHWSTCWEEFKGAETGDAKLMADASLGELARMYARLGRVDDLETLLAEVSERVVVGPGGTLVEHARGGLGGMKNTPEIAFKCGPMALFSLRQAAHEVSPLGEEIANAESTPIGFSLAEVAQLSETIGMDLVPAKRNGGEYPLGSVIHWKLDHYAALIRKDGEKYVVADPTFGDEMLLTREALDEESSGYFLVSASQLTNDLVQIHAEEAAGIYGKGYATDSDPDGTSPDDEKEPPCKPGRGMADYSFHLMLASLHITDTPLFYTPPVGPALDFRLSYNQREASQPATFSYSNFGAKWVGGYCSYVEGNLTGTTTVYVHTAGGGRETHSSFNSGNGAYESAKFGGAKLFRTSSSPIKYERRHPDGSKEVFEHIETLSGSNKRAFMTGIVDPSGNALVLSYDAYHRITTITDAIGQDTTLCYELDGGGDCAANTTDYRIRKVTDPFGRSARFDYDGSGRLIKITDMIGIESEFTYSGDFITSLETPYGVTTFEKESGGASWPERWIQATDPYGETERAEFNKLLPASSMDIPASELPDAAKIKVSTYHLNDRNTFYWDKLAYRTAGRDYTKAKVYHFGLSASHTVSRILDSIDNPFENRVFFNYENYSPSDTSHFLTTSFLTHVGRKLDDGTTQVEKYTVNALGKITERTDPAGRKTKFTYNANLIDLEKVEQLVAGGAWETLGEASYNAQHLPESILDASGAETTVTYNSEGQVESITDAQDRTTTFEYDADGYLLSVISPDEDNYTDFTYDAYGRIETVTSFPEDYTVVFAYDALDRPTLITYPDATTEEFVYDKLDLAKAKDREGGWTAYFHDKLRRLVAVSDPEGQITQMEYCKCGSPSRLVDGLGNITSWEYDIQGRVTSKSYANGNTRRYEYEDTTSRLKRFIDAKSQYTNFAYNTDDSLASISVTNVAAGTASVPTVSFTYDTYYPRIASFTDGVGATSYSYVPIDATNGTYGDGQLASVNGPWSNDTISYSYDLLGRVVERSVDGDVTTLSFDTLDRVTETTTSLAVFSYAYETDTDRVASITSNTGHVVQFDYFGEEQDFDLKTIENLAPGSAPVSRFDYMYSPDGLIKSWTQQTDSDTPEVDSIKYDPSLRVEEVIRRVSGGVTKQWNWRYDEATNRLSEQFEDRVGGTTRRQTVAVNSANQMLTTSNSGPVHVSGSLGEQGLLLREGQPTLPTDSETSFSLWADSPAQDRATIWSRDYSANEASTTYEFATDPQPTQLFSYDLNGNMTEVTTISADGETSSTTTYEWDAHDQLTAVVRGIYRTEFTYDGFGRRIRIHEKNSGSTTSNKTFLWDEFELLERRDSTGATVERRLFHEGEVRLDTGGAPLKLFYMTDHLGSIREAVDEGGTVRARYNYEPYGARTKVSGDLDIDFGYTGVYFHEPSGLCLMVFRAYDPTTGRWISRDPIGEIGGINLYAYVGGNPIYWTDVLGLITAWEGFQQGAMDGYMGFSVGIINAFVPGTKDYTNPCNKDQQFGKLVGAATAAAEKELALMVLTGGGGKRPPRPRVCKINSLGAGTLVQTPEGLVPIEDILPGDMVLAWDDRLAEVVEREVTNIYASDDKLLCSISIEEEVLWLTPDHPIWLEDECGWVDAGFLEKGMRVRLVTGRVVLVQSAGIDTQFGAAYNLSVDGAENFFVGNSGLLVHNCPRRARADVAKGRGPKDISRIDGPQSSVPGSQFHAHDRFGGAMNLDGTFHDAIPRFSNKTIEWLKSNGWAAPKW